MGQMGRMDKAREPDSCCERAGASFSGNLESERLSRALPKILSIRSIPSSSHPPAPSHGRPFSGSAVYSSFAAHPCGAADTSYMQ